MFQKKIPRLLGNEPTTKSPPHKRFGPEGGGFQNHECKNGYIILPETNIFAPENRPRKRRFLLETIIFRCYVSCRECNTNPQHSFKNVNPKKNRFKHPRSWKFEEKTCPVSLEEFFGEQNYFQVIQSDLLYLQVGGHQQPLKGSRFHHLQKGHFESPIFWIFC